MFLALSGLWFSKNCLAVLPVHAGCWMPGYIDTRSSLTWQLTNVHEQITVCCCIPFFVASTRDITTPGWRGEGSELYCLMYAAYYAAYYAASVRTETAPRCQKCVTCSCGNMNCHARHRPTCVLQLAVCGAVGCPSSTKLNLKGIYWYTLGELHMADLCMEITPVGWEKTPTWASTQPTAPCALRHNLGARTVPQYTTGSTLVHTQISQHVQATG